MNRVLRETTAYLLFVLMALQSVAAQGPTWWAEQNVLVPQATPDDFAAINQGQLKTLATAAFQAMEDRLSGGAGAAVRTLVESWQQPTLNTDDFAVVSVGQLKQVASPFYDRLNQINGSTGYPWSSGTSPDDYSIVNIGQAKMVFAFAIPISTPLSIPPSLPVVTDPYIGTAPGTFHSLTISQPNWAPSTSRSFSVTDISENGDSGDPSDDVFWEVSKVEWSFTENEEHKPFFSNYLDGLLYSDSKWKIGKKVRAETDRYAGEDCQPTLDIFLCNDGDQCGCQHETPNLFTAKRLFDPLNPDFWSKNNPFILKCDKSSNQLKYQAIVAIRIRVNNPVAADNSTERLFKVTMHHPIWGDVTETKTVTIFPNSKTGIYWEWVPPGGWWVEMEALDSAEDGSSAPLSIADAAGPRYRKVGLNGVPISDARPQICNENGEEEEETYIDAFSAQVRHSVSDVYVADASTLLPLAVRRDVSPDSWNDRYGLRPAERPCQPFGAGWSSNVCSYVHFTNDGDAVTAEVVDEMGGCQRFVRQGDRWLHDGQETRDMKSYQNELITSLPRLEPVMANGEMVGQEVYDTIRLKKKFGSTCDYQMISPALLSQLLSQDRINHEGGYTVHAYARLNRVTDRFGNELKYDYPFDNTLIPERISDPKRPGHQILLQQTEGLITAVRGPGGDLITYQYGIRQENAPNAPAEPSHTLPATVLTSVTKNFNQTETQGSDIVRYDYTLDQVFIPDDRDEPTAQEPPKPVVYTNLELRSITDERGAEYRFNHQRNDSILRFTGKTYKIAMGQPMTLTSVILPNNQVTTIQTTDLDGNLFNPHTNPRLKFPHGIGVSSPGVRVVITPPCTAAATPPCYTYKFSLPELIPLIGLSTKTGAITLGYKIMTLTAPDGGTESYYYDGAEIGLSTRTPGFSMLLTCVRDRNGQQTRFVYGDKPVGMPFSFDDPTQEITTIATNGGTTRDIVKTMTYDSVSRILKRTAVKRGIIEPIAEITTTYEIDGKFRRTSETHAGKAGNVELPGGSKKSLVYGHATFPGFVTSETLDAPTARAAAGTATVPGITEVPAITKKRFTEASSPNNPGWWRTISEETTIGNPLSLTGTTLQNTTAVTKTWSDFNGNKRAVCDARGHVTEFQYDRRHRLVKVIHPDSSFKTLAYDGHGNLIQETDELGTATFHEYDVLNRRIKTTLDLNHNSQPDERYQTVEVNGTVTTYNGDLVTETTYNHFNLPVTVTDPRGVVTLHEYDMLGRLVKQTVNSTGALKQVFSYSFRETGVNGDKEAGSTLFDTGGFKPVKVTDPRGHVTLYEYDSLYRQIREIRPDGGIIHKNYDDTGLLSSVSEPTSPGKSAANLTSTVYNAQGKPQRVTFADNLFTETYYTPSGQPWKSIDETGLETRIHYNSAGMPVRSIVMSGTTAALHPATITTYDLAGNPNRITDPRGNTTQQFHDQRNRLIQVIAPQVPNSATTPPGTATPTTLTSYDALGRVTATTDSLGAVTQKIYDPAGRVTAVIDALFQSTLMSYNQTGALLTTTNALNQTTTNVYDALGRLTTTTDAAGNVNQFGYDLAGNRISVKDGKNQETTFAYDAFNRLTQQTFANGDSWSYDYISPWVSASIPANYLDKSKQTDPAGRVTTFTYDKRHRLTQMVRTKASGLENYELSAAYTYGTGASAGRLLRVVNKTLGASVSTTGPVATTVTTSYTYDKQGRIVTETNNAQVHKYEYDLAGNQTKSTLDCGSVSHIILTNYDALNRPASIVDNNATTATTADDLITIYGYDLAGHAITLKQANGQTTHNTYDALGRLTARTLKSGMGVTQVGFTWQHDAIGSVIRQDESWTAAGAGQPARSRSTVNSYDAAGRLSTEVIDESGSPTVSTTNTYDSAHNRTRKLVVGGTGAGDWAFTYNVTNQLTRAVKIHASDPVETTMYSYDRNGNRTASNKSIGSSDSYQTFYQWNAWDKLIGVNLTGGKKFSYTYDYRTRRVAAAQAPAGGLTARHTAVVFSGGLSVAEFERTTVTGTLAIPAVRYQRGPDMGGGVGGLLRTLRNPVSASTGLPAAPTATTPATLKFNLSNGRGDIVAQSDATGSLTWTASYEAFGKRTKETGSNADKQRANSKDEDPTGLLNEGFRYRDLETGVWLSRDPAGFVDGPNLYAYVQQNPWTKFDPLGLAEESVVVKAIKERNALVAQTYENAGRQDGANAQRAKFERGQAAASAMAGGMNELVSNTPIGAANEAFTGVNAMGDPLSAGERLAVLAGFVPAGKFAGRLGKAGVDALSSSAQEISKKADEIVDAIRKGGGGAAKRGPKTDPTAPHNAKIKFEGDRLADEGNEILAGGGRAPEKAIPTPGGNKGSRRPDVLYKTPDGTTKGLNVGKTKADGSPVTREQKAMDDLNGAGVETDFIPYDR